MKHIKLFESMNSNIYIKSVEIISDIHPLKSGIKIEFKEPVTIIVGDNGVGKSTILECIRDSFGYKDDTYLRRSGTKSNIKLDKVDDKFNFNYIDFHGDDRKFSGSFGDNIQLQINQMKLSSGQVSISLLNDKLKDIEKVRNGVVILDEPCRGQSIKNQYRLLNLIQGLTTKLNCQVILTTHSDIILKSLDGQAQYYDISINGDTTYKSFMISQLTTPTR